MKLFYAGSGIARSFVLISFMVTAFCNITSIEYVDDTDLVHILTGEDNVVALFTKDNCPECIELETVIGHIQNELKESLQAVVVKAHNSNVLSIYNPSKEPSLIYFRRGIPLLYYGPTNGDEIVQTFSDNRAPIVKELTDENFEHLTQAASGATTGDWFILFYSVDCVFCQRLYATWEAVGSKLKSRLNVARINRLESGISTAKRFGVLKSPSFIFLRHGKLYRYKKNEFIPKKFIEFVESDYRKENHPEPVPAIPSFINYMLERMWEYLADRPLFFFLGSVVMCVAILLGVIFKCLSLKKATKTNKKSK